MEMLHEFWAPRKMYKPCGMFTKEHLILLCIGISILSFLLIISVKITIEKVDILTKILAIFLTFLEGVKIFFNFYWGYTKVRYWFPISFCSIFIYALWMSGFFKNKLKKMGDSFISGAAIVAGVAYLIFPSTSLTIYPMKHYLCIYSIVFHILMIYMGVIYLRKKQMKLNLINFREFTIIYLVFFAVAITINYLTNSNLMLISSPGNIPIKLIHDIYKFNSYIYTSLVFIIYLIVPYWSTSFIVKIIKKIKNSRFLFDDKNISELRKRFK